MEDEEDYNSFMGEVVGFVRGDLLSKGIPEEVVWVMMMEMYCRYVGSETMDRINEIKARHPKHYPWEAKYNSLDKGVHEAYWREVSGDGVIGVNDWGGLESKIGRGCTEYKDATMEDFVSFMDGLRDIERDREKEDKRVRGIWDKHYRKYGLKYRG